MTKGIRALEKTERTGEGVGSSSPVKSERGIALVLVLVLSAMALAMMAALVYMLTISTHASGTQKRYSNAVEAGKAGTDMSFDMITARGTLVPSIYSNINLDIPATSVSGVDCLTQKLNQDTSTWDNICDKTVSINPNDTKTYDWTFKLGDAGGGQQFNVYSKIVDTVAGNTGGGTGLAKNGVVTSTGEVSVVRRPYLYTLEVDAEQGAAQKERARYSVLYQY